MATIFSTVVTDNMRLGRCDLWLSFSDNKEAGEYKDEEEGDGGGEGKEDMVGSAASPWPTTTESPNKLRRNVRTSLLDATRLVPAMARVAGEKDTHFVPRCSIFR